MATTMTPDEIKSLKGRGWLHNKGTDSFSARVITVNGQVTADQLQAVAEAARKYGSGDVTFTSRQTIEVLGVPAQKTDDFEAAVAAAGMSVGGTGPKVRPVTACKGTVCPRGIRANSAASFTRCASPPERVVAGCPRVIYPSPTSCKVLNLRANPVMFEKSSTA